VIYELQTVVPLEWVYRHVPKNEKELSVTAIIEFRHFTCALQNWTLVTSYCNNILKISKFKNQGLFYLKIIIIMIWNVVKNVLHQQQDDTAAVSTELTHYMKRRICSHMLLNWSYSLHHHKVTCSEMWLHFCTKFCFKFGTPVYRNFSRSSRNKATCFAVHAHCTTNKFVSVWCVGYFAPDNIHGLVYHKFIPHRQTVN
jgi:hypothetical protein